MILTLLGRSTGKVSAIAKGARKSTSKMRSSVQLFSQGNYLLYRGKSLYTLTQCETKEPFLILRQDLSKFAYASYCVEIIREALPEGEVNLPAYNLLSNVLKMMCISDERLAARLFDFRMLKISGYLPHLTCCVKCGRPLPDKAVFSSQDGGMVCCGGVSGVLVGKDTVAIMSRLAEIEISKANRLKPSPKHLSEMEKVTKAYWETVLEKPLQSVEFIDRMRQFA